MPNLQKLLGRNENQTCKMRLFEVFLDVRREKEMLRHQRLAHQANKGEVGEDDTEGAKEVIETNIEFP